MTKQAHTPTLTCEERERRAKKWGRANGYFGRPGGWIYTTSPTNGRIRPVCQGWFTLYIRNAQTIEASREGA